MSLRVPSTAAVLTALVLLSACASRPPLLDERKSEPYAGWLRRGDLLERSAERIEAQRPGAAPLRMNLVSVRGAGERAGPLLVLLPGVLSDHRTWRFLAPLLADDYDLLLVDPPGTGASDKPDPRVHPTPAYTPAWLGRHTLRAVDRWQQQHGDDRRLVLVGHSIGSSAFVQALSPPARQAELADVSARVERLVLFSLPDVATDDVDPLFEEIATVSDLEIALGDALGIVDAKVDEAIYASVVCPSRAAFWQEARRLQASLTNACTRRTAQAMLLRFVPLDACSRPLRAAVDEIAARERTMTVETLVVLGAEDVIIPPPVGRRAAARLPNARVQIVERGKHSLHQERADRAAALVRAFVGRGSGPAPTSAMPAPAVRQPSHER